jgi:DNA-binding transcriptional MerR regulator
MKTNQEFSSKRRLLKTREVGEMIGISPKRVRRLSQLGVLKPVRLVPSGDLRFRVEDVERLIRGQT